VAAAEAVETRVEAAEAAEKRGVAVEEKRVEAEAAAQSTNTARLHG
jgi:hypothetical protein